MRRHLTAVALAIAALLWTTASADAAPERRVALVIGNGSYSALGNLKNASSDAAAMADKLKGFGYDVTPVKNADQATVLKALRTFREKAAGADLAVVFYAGHGIQSNGENYLLPVDINVQDEIDLPDSALSLHRLVSQLQAGGARRSLIILDACRDNPLVKRFADAARGGGRSTAVGRGLAVVEKTPNETVVWFSAEAGQVASDGDGRNSPFTTSLLAALDRPGLSTDDVFRQVVKEVRGQTPRPYGMFSDPVFLRPGAPPPAAVSSESAPAVAPVAPPVAPGVDASTMELAFWQSAEKGGTLSAYQAYAKKYPKGQFIELAHAKIADLRKAQQASAAPAAPVVKPPPEVKPPPPVLSESAEIKALAQGARRQALAAQSKASEARRRAMETGRDVSEGYGIRTYGTGERYEGEIRGGERNGHGVNNWPTGFRYEGEWVHGKLTGYGVITEGNGRRSEGQYRDNKRNGYGVYTWADGEVYEGEWRDDLRSGRGVQTAANGTILAGIWRDGSLAQPFAVAGAR